MSPERLEPWPDPPPIPEVVPGEDGSESIPGFSYQESQSIRRVVKSALDFRMARRSSKVSVTVMEDALETLSDLVECWEKRELKSP